MAVKTKQMRPKSFVAARPAQGSSLILYKITNKDPELENEVLEQIFPFGYDRVVFIQGKFTREGSITIANPRKKKDKKDIYDWENLRWEYSEGEITTMSEKKSIKEIPEEPLDNPTEESTEEITSESIHGQIGWLRWGL